MIRRCNPVGPRASPRDCRTVLGIYTAAMHLPPTSCRGGWRICRNRTRAYPAISPRRCWPPPETGRERRPASPRLPGGPGRWWRAAMVKRSLLRAGRPADRRQLVRRRAWTGRDPRPPAHQSKASAAAMIHTMCGGPPRTHRRHYRPDAPTAAPLLYASLHGFYDTSRPPSPSPAARSYLHHRRAPGLPLNPAPCAETGSSGKALLPSRLRLVGPPPRRAAPAPGADRSPSRPPRRRWLQSRRRSAPRRAPGPRASSPAPLPDPEPRTTQAWALPQNHRDGEHQSLVDLSGRVRAVQGDEVDARSALVQQAAARVDAVLDAELVDRLGVVLDPFEALGHLRAGTAPTRAARSGRSCRAWSPA